ncbi:fructosamine kinase family protein [Vibrio sp. B1Z05]|uniref:fructosamine kinase family protein n=1 Tax=Vibrio sp. B1Z05 TaxID=2654980 RepID=UPI00128E4F37|nr:fructosamine kinase family protein [Vibrio sp. B1Z05]MPW36520.1 phosphotransferase [Vibrio sp. B1Z05]
MWQAITQQLSDILMFEFKIEEKSRITSGNINESYMISDGEQRYFIKLNNKAFLSKFTAEVDNLTQLQRSNTVYTPEIVHLGSTKDCAFLILNYLPTHPLTHHETSYQFGQEIARLHLWGEQQEYGFDHDNYIGATLQPNRWQKKWCVFFAEQRIGWQLQLLKEKGIEFGDQEQIINCIKSELANHQPKPSLLHGDLWHGNCAESPFGPICYDPACYWGDHECDLAMTELFGDFPDSFYQGYKTIKPLADGYERRKHIYNLYHILNHCNLFAGHYLGEAQQRIDHLLERYY